MRGLPHLAGTLPEQIEQIRNAEIPYTIDWARVEGEDVRAIIPLTWTDTLQNAALTGTVTLYEQ